MNNPLIWNCIVFPTFDLPYFCIPGLNVYSMLKHETLVLTMAAVEKIEEKLIEAMHSQKPNTKFHRGSYKSLWH